MTKKVKRKIIVIDEEKCNGCGLCIPSCPEQALQIVETPKGPKARLVKEFYCDGLGACLGSCPTGALTIEEKETEPYDEEATIERIKEVAPEMLEVHLKHMKEHSQHTNHHVKHSFSGCPSSQTMHWNKNKTNKNQKVEIESELQQWPIQLHLVNPAAPYFKNADIMFVADCVPFAYGNFHQDFLKGKAIAIACPKLDDLDGYYEKVRQIIELNNPKSITVVNMEVPCCFGLLHIVEEAVNKLKKKPKIKQVIVGIKGDIVEENEV